MLLFVVRNPGRGVRNSRKTDLVLLQQVNVLKTKIADMQTRKIDNLNKN